MVYRRGGSPHAGAYIFGYTWQPVGLEQETYPSLRSVQTIYDGAGRPNSVTGTLSGTSTSYAQNAAYAPHGALEQFSMGNGVTETTTFNFRLRPLTITAAGSSTQLLSLTYGYSGSADNGNVLTQQIQRLNGGSQSTWMQSYGYDGLNRLTCANEVTGGTALTCNSGSPGWQETEGYDVAGNRWVAGSTGLPALTSTTPQSNGWFGSTTYSGGVYSGSPKNQVLSSAGWCYDSNGNLTAIGSTLGYSYDAENRQHTATVNGAVTTYGYDGNGHRVTKTLSSGGVTTYVYDAMNQLAADYPAQVEATGTTYLTADALGSTRLETNVSGSAVSCSDYTPFGGGSDAGGGFEADVFSDDGAGWGRSEVYRQRTGCGVGAGLL